MVAAKIRAGRISQGARATAQASRFPNHATASAASFPSPRSSDFSLAAALTLAVLTIRFEVRFQRGSFVCQKFPKHRNSQTQTPRRLA